MEWKSRDARVLSFSFSLYFQPILQGLQASLRTPDTEQALNAVLSIALNHVLAI